MRFRVPVLCCVLLVVATAGAPSVAAQPDAEETRLEAQLEADGDARWTIVATIPLEDEEDVEDFRAFADAYEEGDRDFQLGVDAFERAAEESSRASGREMSIRGADREAVVVNETEDGEVVERYGELRVSFTWTSFARVDENGTIYVDDAFNTTNGTWLPGLDEDQTLVIRSPQGYGGPSTSPIGAAEGDLEWTGPQTFEPGYFEIVYPKTRFGSTPPLTLTNVLLGGAILLSTVALGLGGYLLWRRDGDATGVTIAAEETAPESEAGPEAGNGAEAAAVGAAAATEADADEADAEDPELLSDEERVEYLLEQNGGRMKQATIVKETGWSNAKVSQLLSAMEADGRIDKLRIGRENLISLPGENVGDLADLTDED